MAILAGSGAALGSRARRAGGRHGGSWMAVYEREPAGPDNTNGGSARSRPAEPLQNWGPCIATATAAAAAARRRGSRQQLWKHRAHRSQPCSDTRRWGWLQTRSGGPALQAVADARLAVRTDAPLNLRRCDPDRGAMLDDRRPPQFELELLRPAMGQQWCRPLLPTPIGRTHPDLGCCLVLLGMPQLLKTKEEALQACAEQHREFCGVRSTARF